MNTNTSKYKVTNYRAIFKILGLIITIVGIGEVIPWIYAEAISDVETATAFRICAPLTIALGLTMYIFIQSGRSRFGAREGYLTVALCWIVASIIGAFPYLLSGFCDTYIDSFFEASSGFTTTGCTVTAHGHHQVDAAVLTIGRNLCGMTRIFSCQHPAIEYLMVNRPLYQFGNSSLLCSSRNGIHDKRHRFLFCHLFDYFRRQS